ncbi:MAG: chemotaxis protein CheC [Oscillospiraceae bacterium]
MNSGSENLDSIQQDVLREIANIGSGHAATALSRMLGCPIEQSVPNVMVVPLSEMSTVLGGAEKVVVAGMIKLIGDFSGYLIMVLDFDQAKKIISMVCGDAENIDSQLELYRFSALDKSVLAETANILGGSYMSAIAEFTGLKMSSSVPYLCIDMVGAVMSVAVAEAGKTGDFAFLFQSELFNESERIIGNLLLIPEEKSCDIILKTLGFI